MEALSKHYSASGRTVEALHDINFVVRPSEVVSIVGPSGCGKSTLLKILAGLISYDGKAQIDGEPVVVPRRDVGLMFQSSLLFPWRTVLANVMLPARIHRHVDEATKQRALDLLAMVGLRDFALNHPHELSGGMQQRAALCRVLLEDPTILLLDEPFGALDELTREALNIALLDIQQRTKKTLMLVTHSVYEAVFLADRVLVMSSRPGVLLRDITIELPRPRDIHAMQEPRFLEYVTEIRDLLGVGRDETDVEAGARAAESKEGVWHLRAPSNTHPRQGR